MPKKYTPRKETGVEYLQAVRGFSKYTIFKISQFPDKWKDWISTPLFNAVTVIENECIRANKVYIQKYGKKNSELTAFEREQLIEAYKERIGHLKRALEEFSVFDTAFEKMMDHIDLYQTERRRMNGVFKNIVKEAEARGETEINIKVETHLNEVHYETAFGEQKVKIGLTAKNKDYWLKLEYIAMEEIKNRLAKDRSLLKTLSNSAA